LPCAIALKLQRKLKVGALRRDVAWTSAVLWIGQACRSGAMASSQEPRRRRTQAKAPLDNFCGGAMTLRTGKSGRYKYYTCSTKARQGETGCKGRTVPMEKLDSVVAEHIEQRLLQPKRLEQILAAVLHRREERGERRTAHIAELRKRAAEAEAKLKRLYDAIENGIADVSDPMLKERVTELKAVRDQARADAERAAGALDYHAAGAENLRQQGPQAHADRVGRLPP
jgi:hypothetical protein